jgi:hypothetical protein
MRFVMRNFIGDQFFRHEVIKFVSLRLLSGAVAGKLLCFDNTHVAWFREGPYHVAFLTLRNFCVAFGG